MTIIVEFGSRVRGDNDSLSDKDILIVPSKEDILPYNHHYHAYTKNRLQKIKHSESLFLVHLRNEGRIISDEKCWMESFLRSIPNYMAPLSEISKAKLHLSVFLSIAPTDKQQTWWLDCTYVFLRDYLIKRNSLSGNYNFSPLEFGKTDVTNIPVDLTEVIQNLRIGKAVHRSDNSMQLRVSIDWIKEKLIGALKLKINKMPLHEVFFMSKDSDTYFELRLVEGLILSKEVTVKDDSILKIIKNPQLYSWDIKQGYFLEKVEWNSAFQIQKQLFNRAV